MRYLYDGSGRYLLGLPARDLDDAELGDEQRELLAAGVAAGIYAAPEPKPHHPTK